MATLTRTQLDELRGLLEQRGRTLRDDIRRELQASDEESYSDLAGRVHDSGEASVADLLADMNIAMIDRQVQDLRRVEAALRRMDMGIYGECDECGCEIGYERLRSYPTAKRCVECQALYEHTHAHEPTPSL